MIFTLLVLILLILILIMSSIVYYYTGKFNFLQIIAVLSQIKEKNEMKRVF